MTIGKIIQKLILPTIILLAGAVSCIDQLQPAAPDQPQKFEGLRVVGQVQPFGNVNVGTKGIKTSDESVITNMMMIVTVGQEGRIIEKQFVHSDKPMFTILSSEEPYHSLVDADKSNLYIHIVANIPGSPAEDYDPENPMSGATQGSVYSQLMSASCDTYTKVLNISFPVIDGIDIPELGFPMDGVSPVLDLTETETNKVLEIPLTCMYAKVVFNIAVRPTQIIDEVIQQFALTEWTVTNVPQSVKIGQSLAETGASVSKEVIHSTKVDNGVNPVQQGGGNMMSFSFYVPEHRVNPKTNTYRYPWTSDKDAEYQDYKQFFKPDLAKDNALKVTISGRYRDHNNRIREVTYTLYPGFDNYEDFNLVRDNQYNNNITIKGVTSHTLATNETVTYDHRVDVKQQEFDFGLQRETLLDSHWEIRPIRIRFDKSKVQNGFKLRINIKNPSSSGWIRMEMPTPTQISTDAARAEASRIYCTVDQSDAQSRLASGKRRYFTTDLVSSTLSGGTSFEVEYHEDRPDEEYTIWTYIDEYVNKTDADNHFNGTHPGYRSAVIECSLLDGNDVELYRQEYIFRQKNVYKVVYGGNPYYIEYFEEYLYNFDVDDNYGQTSDGMEWGFPNVQLSKTNPAIYLKVVTGSGNQQTNVANGIKAVSPRYDFYMSRDLANNSFNQESGLPVRADYSGLEFTKEIAQTAISSSKMRSKTATNQIAESAIEYCYNRNKRNADGTITAANITWYLPAIDEIEEICKGGYGEFEVFQDKLYWSSQPSFKRGLMNFYDRGQKGYFLPFFGEDAGLDGVSGFDGRARATKVNNSFNTVKSESYGIQSAIRLAGSALNGWEVLDNIFYNVYPGHPVSDTERKNYRYLIIMNPSYTYNLVHQWTDPSPAQLAYYRDNDTWQLPDSHASYTINNSNGDNYGATWKDYYYFYDEGNCPRVGEEHRVRCVRKL